MKTKTITWLLVLFFMQAGNAFSQNPMPCSCNLGACSGSLISIDYNDNAGWSSLLSNPGSMGIGLGVMNYFATPGSNYNRMMTNASSMTLYSQNFVAECKISISGGNSPGHYVMAFTETTDDPISTNGAGYPLTNNDALAVVLIKEGAAPTSNSCCTNPCLAGQNWLLQIMSKDGASSPTYSTGIPVRCQLTVTYYVRLVRSGCWTYLGVYSDPGFTTHVSGSPVCMIVPASNTGYRRLQHGVITWSSALRTLSMTLDNMRVCPYTTGCTVVACTAPPFANGAEAVAIKEISLDDADRVNLLTITPNPSAGSFKLKLNNADEKIMRVAIYDMRGKLYKLVSTSEQEDAVLVNANDFNNGIYFIEAYGTTKSWKAKIVIQR